MNKKTIAIGVSGGIAAYKVIDLVSRLAKKGFQTEVVMTEAAAELVGPFTFATISGRPVHTKMFQEQYGDHMEVEPLATAPI